MSESCLPGDAWGQHGVVPWAAWALAPQWGGWDVGLSWAAEKEMLAFTWSSPSPALSAEASGWSWSVFTDRAAQNSGRGSDLPSVGGSWRQNQADPQPQAHPGLHL